MHECQNCPEGLEEFTVCARGGVDIYSDAPAVHVRGLWSALCVAHSLAQDNHCVSIVMGTKKIAEINHGVPKALAAYPPC